MYVNHRSQRGMTFLGMLIIGMFVAVVAYGAFRLVPVYLEHMKIVNVLDGLKEEMDGTNPSALMLRKSIERRMDVEAITVITFKDIKLSKSASGYFAGAKYENIAPFVANVSFVVNFDKTVEIKR